MATTFLQLSNELLRELNEVVLTSATFSNAVGIQQHAKDCINRAYLDIANEEPQWPFLATGESGATDPMYGNVSVDTTAGTRSVSYTHQEKLQNHHVQIVLLVNHKQKTRFYKLD